MRSANIYFYHTNLDIIRINFSKQYNLLIIRFSKKNPNYHKAITWTIHCISTDGTQITKSRKKISLSEYFPLDAGGDVQTLVVRYTGEQRQFAGRFR